MTTVISILKADGSIEHDMAFYLMAPADAVRNYYYQFYQKNYNTWEYNKAIDIGVKPTPNGGAILVVASNGDTIYGKKEDDV